LRYLPALEGACFKPLVEWEEARLNLWRVAFSSGDWFPLAVCLDPPRSREHEVLGRFKDRRLAYHCYMKAWACGDRDGMLQVGRMLLEGDADESLRRRGLGLIRYLAGPSERSTNAAHQLVRTFKESSQFGFSASSLVQVDDGYASAWCYLARQWGVEATNDGFWRLVEELEDTLPPSSADAWRWIQAFELRTGTVPDPDLFAGGRAAVPGPRERVIAAAREHIPFDYYQLTGVIETRGALQGIDEVPKGVANWDYLGKCFDPFVTGDSPPGGREKSMPVALACYLRAVERDGDRSALRRIGMRLLQGVGTDGDHPALGHRVLVWAALSGDRKACEELRDMRNSGRYLSQDEALAMAWAVIKNEGADPDSREARLAREQVEQMWGRLISEAEAWDRVERSIRSRGR
jgi:hypothetical protein